MQHHRHTVFGAKRNRVENFDAMTGNKCQAETLRNCGQQQRRFNHGEASANTDARSAAEREIGEARHEPATDRLTPPALRLEPLWLRIKTRIAVDDPLEKKNIRARRETIPAKVEGLDCAPADSPCRWIKPHGFL